MTSGSQRDWEPHIRGGASGGESTEYEVLPEDKVSPSGKIEGTSRED